MKQNDHKNHEFNFDENEQLHHPIIQKHKKLLELVSDEKIFCVLCNNEKDFFLLECCDGYYGYDLDKEDCLELSELFREIADVV